MKIQKITVSPLKASLIQPFRVALGQHNDLDNLLVKLELEDKTMGFGEAAVASHITGETVPQTRQNLLSITKYLKGKSVFDYPKISCLLHEAFPRNKSAVAAIEIALLDALTRHLNIPLWKMFGQKPQLLASDITIVISPLQETQLKTKEFYKMGFRAFKIKVGSADMDLDFKRVRAVAELAPQSSLILDANQGYNAAQALKFIKELVKSGIKIDLIEQPVKKADVDGLRCLTKAIKIPICADESASSLEQALFLIKNNIVSAINIKLMKTGLVHSLEIARVAKACGFKLMIGGMMESNIAMTTAAHMASGLGCFDFVDLDTPFFIKGELSKNPYLRSYGVYDLRKSKPGIGINPL